MFGISYALIWSRGPLKEAAIPSYHRKTDGRSFRQWLDMAGTFLELVVPDPVPLPHYLHISIVMFWNCDDSLWKLLYIQYLVGSAFLLGISGITSSSCKCFHSLLEKEGPKGYDVNQMSDLQIWKTGVEEKVTLTSCFRRCEKPSLCGSSILMHFPEIT